MTKETINYGLYNNISDVYEYDYGTGTAGSLLRRTHTDYLTTNNGVNYATDTNIHLRSLPSKVQVFSDAAGTIKKSESTVEYDNYTPETNNPRHAVLLNRTNISGLDTVGTSRGNVTATTSYVDATTLTGAVTSFAQYDIAGNVVKTIDANGNTTTLEYDDRFGTPNGNAQSNVPTGESPFVTAPSTWLAGQTTFAFPTKVTNALGHTAYTQFDYFLGKAVDNEDPNNIKSSMYYDDALDRPTQSRRNVTSATVYYSRSTIVYDDTNRVITATSDKDTVGDNALVSKSYYDGLGRTYRSAVSEGGTAWMISETQFDALGRAYRTTNPARDPLSPTGAIPSPQWTTMTFDALGRVLQVKTPDNAIVSTAYSGNQIIVTDQAGKQRKSEIDTLGRLLKVWEAPNIASLNYLTTYQYDTLDNLLRVTQTGQDASNTTVTQNRFFAYDSLRRLIRAKNVEQGNFTPDPMINSRKPYTYTYDPVTSNASWSMGYCYDNNGNLVERSDANNVKTTYAYDALNRVTVKGYSPAVNGTANVDYFYDAAVNGKGKFFYDATYNTESNGTLAYNYDFINSYDALGRPTSKKQSFLYYQGGYALKDFTTAVTYDLASNVLSQTYPSGRTVNYSYNTASQMTSFSGKLGNITGAGNTNLNYATDLKYTAAGLLARETLGTTTALYHRMNYNVRQQLFAVRVGTDSNAALDVNPQAAGLTDYNGWGSSWDRGMLITHYGNQGATNDYSSWGTSGTNNNGNVLRGHHYIPGGIYVNDYEYDDLNRLKKDSGWGNSNYTQAFDYDRWGNRTINQSLTTTSIDINKKLFSVTAANNQLGVPSGQTGAMTFDPVGNLIFDSYTNPGKIDAMTYDAENHMTSAANGGHQYRYNADGKRVKRTVTGTGGGTFWMVYGIGGELVAEYNATSGIPAPTTPNKEYGYRNGQMLVVWDDTETDANLKLKWLVQDQLGSTRMEIGLNGASNAVVRHDYLAFGEELAGSMRSAANGYGTATKTKQKFTGYEKDAETGLDYAQARYYSNTQGRFTSADSIGGQPTNPQTLNLYSYVKNNPLRYNDPTGHNPASDNEGDQDPVKPFIDPVKIPSDMLIPTNERTGDGGIVYVYEEIGLDDKEKGQPSFFESLIPVWGPGKSAIAYGNTDQLEMGLVRMQFVILDLFPVRSAAVGAGRIGLKFFGTKALEEATQTVVKEAVVEAGVVVASEAGNIGEMMLVRRIQKGEILADIIDEGKALTYLTGNEHALVGLNDGTRALVSGGAGGIELFGVKRIFGHIHPYQTLPTGPSAFDRAALATFGQRSSWLVEQGVITKFGR